MQSKENNVVLNTLHLFAGAGGGILADKILGHRVIGAVEIEPYARKVLLARQLDGTFSEFPIWDDVTTFRIDNPDTRSYIERLKSIRDNLCISGGFPCQNISAAGKGAGLSGGKSRLWSEMARIIHEVRPSYAFVENSPMLTSRGLGTILGDLASMGFYASWGVLGASDVGAKHKRERIWIVAHTNNAKRGRELRGLWSLQKCNQEWDTYSTFNQPEPIRMVDGMAHRSHRLKAIGNGQVPLCAATAWKMLLGVLNCD